MMEAPDVKRAAKALFSAASSIASGSPSADEVDESDSVEIRHFSEVNFTSRNPHITMYVVPRSLVHRESY